MRTLASWVPGRSGGHRPREEGDEHSFRERPRGGRCEAVEIAVPLAVAVTSLSDDQRTRDPAAGESRLSSGGPARRGGTCRGQDRGRLPCRRTGHDRGSTRAGTRGGPPGRERVAVLRDRLPPGSGSPKPVRGTHPCRCDRNRNGDSRRLRVHRLLSGGTGTGRGDREGSTRLTIGPLDGNHGHSPLTRGRDTEEGSPGRRTT